MQHFTMKSEIEGIAVNETDLTDAQVVRRLVEMSTDTDNDMLGDSGVLSDLSSVLAELSGLIAVCEGTVEYFGVTIGIWYD